MPLAIQENVPLAPLTTLGVGGPARYYVEARSEVEIAEAVHWSRGRGIPLFILGGGSNLLVSDRGFPGLVLRMCMSGSVPHAHDTFVARAGTDWDSLVAFAVSKDYAGVECLSGIPGTVGGTPVQNVGAYGQEVSDTIQSVKAVRIHDASLHEIPRAECLFSYRSSRFNTSERGQWIITEVTFVLARGVPPKIAYRDLKEYFAGKNIAKPTIQQVRDAIREIRHRKAMLIVPGDPDAHSAGSFFKNPVLSPGEYRALVDACAKSGETVPSYPADGQSHKVPAAWLVEHAGFTKGYARGPVGISSKHALAIVNRGGARAGDVIALKNDIQQRVHDRFGIELHPEPVMVGFDEL